MNYTFSVKPNSIMQENRMQYADDNYGKYSLAYIGPYTYCWNTTIDNGIEFEADKEHLCYSLHIGNYNSIGNGLTLVFGRNHNFKKITTGALDLMLYGKNDHGHDGNSSFNQKGSIIIQNDVWIGENVTIMAGVIVGNGAVIARNSHVVKSVPPYAIVGGNPAKIIGYRYKQQQIEQLQKIQWWYWEKEKLIENAKYFSEDVDGFCEKFIDTYQNEYGHYSGKRDGLKDCWFVFCDYYENYCSYPMVLESFLEHYIGNEDKKLILFVRNDYKEEPIDNEIMGNIKALINDIQSDENIKCSIEVRSGNIEKAKEAFSECSHYITNRTYDTVYFTCLADMLDIEIVSGVDSLIQFEKSRNIIRA